MSVHYKFKSSLEYDTVTFDGLHISVGDLKKSIIQQKKIGKSSDFDLQITNAQTKEVYKDDETLIPKNSSVIVARIPIPGATKKTWDRGDGNSAVIFPKSFDPGIDGPPFDKLAKTADLTSSNASEDEKIKAMMTQATVDYDPSRYHKVRNTTGPLPVNYMCFRCQKPGHWIKNCPTNSLEVKRSTGIPRSFMVTVPGPEVPGAMITNTGQFAVPVIDHEAYREGKKERPPFAKELTPEKEMKPVIPDELLCMICRDLLSDAVLIPCCGNSYCDECVRQALLDSEEHECPTCHEKDISPDTLIPNRFLRTAVMNFKNETGYTKVKKLLPVAKVEPPPLAIQPTPSVVVPVPAATAAPPAVAAPSTPLPPPAVVQPPSAPPPPGVSHSPPGVPPTSTTTVPPLCVPVSSHGSAEGTTSVTPHSAPVPAHPAPTAALLAPGPTHSAPIPAHSTPIPVHSSPIPICSGSTVPPVKEELLPKPRFPPPLRGQDERSGTSVRDESRSESMAGSSRPPRRQVGGSEDYTAESEDSGDKGSFSIPTITSSNTGNRNSTGILPPSYGRPRNGSMMYGDSRPQHPRITQARGERGHHSARHYSPKPENRYPHRTSAPSHPPYRPPPPVFTTVAPTPPVPPHIHGPPPPHLGPPPFPPPGRMPPPRGPPPPGFPLQPPPPGAVPLPPFDQPPPPGIPVPPPPTVAHPPPQQSTFDYYRDTKRLHNKEPYREKGKNPLDNFKRDYREKGKNPLDNFKRDLMEYRREQHSRKSSRSSSYSSRSSSRSRSHSASRSGSRSSRSRSRSPRPYNHSYSRSRSLSRSHSRSRSRSRSRSLSYRRSRTRSRSRGRRYSPAYRHSRSRSPYTRPPPRSPPRRGYSPGFHSQPQHPHNQPHAHQPPHPHPHPNPMFRFPNPVTTNYPQDHRNRPYHHSNRYDDYQFGGGEQHRYNQPDSHFGPKFEFNRYGDNYRGHQKKRSWTPDHYEKDRRDPRKLKTLENLRREEPSRSPYTSKEKETDRKMSQKRHHKSKVKKEKDDIREGKDTKYRREEGGTFKSGEHHEGKGESKHRSKKVDKHSESEAEGKTKEKKHKLKMRRTQEQSKPKPENIQVVTQTQEVVASPKDAKKHMLPFKMNRRGDCQDTVNPNNIIVIQTDPEVEMKPAMKMKSEVKMKHVIKEADSTNSIPVIESVRTSKENNRPRHDMEPPPSAFQSNLIKPEIKESPEPDSVSEPVTGKNTVYEGGDEKAEDDEEQKTSDQMKEGEMLEENEDGQKEEGEEDEEGEEEEEEEEEEGEAGDEEEELEEEEYEEGMIIEGEDEEEGEENAEEVSESGEAVLTAQIPELSKWEREESDFEASPEREMHSTKNKSSKSLPPDIVQRAEKAILHKPVKPTVVSVDTKVAPKVVEKKIKTHEKPSPKAKIGTAAEVREVRSDSAILQITITGKDRRSVETKDDEVVKEKKEHEEPSSSSRVRLRNKDKVKLDRSKFGQQEELSIRRSEKGRSVHKTVGREASSPGRLSQSSHRDRHDSDPKHMERYESPPRRERLIELASHIRERKPRDREYSRLSRQGSSDYGENKYSVQRKEYSLGRRKEPSNPSRMADEYHDHRSRPRKSEYAEGDREMPKKLRKGSESDREHMRRKGMPKDRRSRISTESYGSHLQHPSGESSRHSDQRPIRTRDRKKSTIDESSFEPNYDEASDSEENVSVKAPVRQKVVQTKRSVSGSPPPIVTKKLKRSEVEMKEKEGSVASEAADEQKDSSSTSSSDSGSASPSSVHSGSPSIKKDDDAFQEPSPTPKEKHKHKKGKHKKHKKHKRKHKKRKSHHKAKHKDVSKAKSKN